MKCCVVIIYKITAQKPFLYHKICCFANQTQINRRNVQITHGRLQNAGIVRKRTPTVPKKYPDRQSPIPRVRNRKNFYNRHFKNKPAGQSRRRR